LTKDELRARAERQDVERAKVDEILEYLEANFPTWHRLLSARVQVFRSGRISPNESLKFAERALRAATVGGEREIFERENWYTNFPYDLPQDSRELKTLEKARIEATLARAGVSDDLVPMTWEKVEDRPDVKGFGRTEVDLRSYCADVRRHRREGVGVNLLGPVGDGKTMLSSLLLRAAVEARLSVMLVRASHYVDSLKPGGAGRQVQEKAVKVDFLVLDDLGSELASDFADVEIEALIAARYDSKRPTIITSNLSPRELEEEYDQRIIDRLKRNVEYVLDGVSYRDRQQKDTLFDDHDMAREEEEVK
jgi:hypothetical protein